MMKQLGLQWRAISDEEKQGFLELADKGNQKRPILQKIHTNFRSKIEFKFWFRLEKIRERNSIFQKIS